MYKQFIYSNYIYLTTFTKGSFTLTSQYSLRDFHIFQRNREICRNKRNAKSADVLDRSGNYHIESNICMYMLTTWLAGISSY